MSVSYFFVAFDNEEKEKENGKEKESSSRRRSLCGCVVLCCIVWCFGWVGDGSELDKRESLLVWRNI